MNATLLSLLVLSIALVPTASALQASLVADECAGEVCDAINRVCERQFGASCVGFAPATEEHADCVGLPCDVINLVCQVAFQRPCVR